MTDFEYILAFIETNALYFSIGIGIIVLIIIIRNWPDVAAIKFIRSGLRGGKYVDRYRDILSENLTSLGEKSHNAEGENKLKIQAVDLERKRISQIVRKHPRLVGEVGKALITMEKLYKKDLKTIESEQAREILRLTTEKYMNDLMGVLSITAVDVPGFEIEIKE